MRFFFGIVLLLVSLLTMLIMFKGVTNYLPPIVIFSLSLYYAYKYLKPNMQRELSKKKDSKKMQTAKKEQVVRYVKTQKICATCDFWQGQRELNLSTHSVIVISNTAKGKCCVEKKLSLPLQPHFVTCVKYKRWVQL